jgi:hypothetical protein
MDVEWGTGMDDTIATTLRTIILQNPLSKFDTACVTAVARIGRGGSGHHRIAADRAGDHGG